MGKLVQRDKKRKIDKKFLSKNKTIKLYKEKQRKIDAYKREVDEITKRYEEIDSATIEDFDDFPLSSRTRKGLRDANYRIPTEIQKESIGLALKGHDILGAAKTGSGKTLAFIIPILERLFVTGWSIIDGLGAIIITPTRELAYQIFEVLNKIGCNHQFSAALVIGGKDIAKERKLLDKCNILICTPGRLQQHMDENPLFDAMNLKILVLDEADRILDMGFKESLNAILENLPQERQTLLFSATQTKSVKDLARLSLKNPMYVSVHEHAKHTTPEGLQQSFLVCEAHDKMNMIWSFIKSHKKQKVLVFMASCKQVKFMYECICRLRPGVSIMAMYGTLHQLRRMAIYDEFCKKNHAVMFATDIAARGLDFPNVNWVVQLDCPEDVNTYIHRAGRTARFEKGGEALLILLPSEKDSMVDQLEKRKIPIEEIKVNPSKLHSIQRKLEAICARDDALKDSGTRAFKSYLKSLSKMKDKTVFDVNKINFELYAKSLGLEFAPRVRFLERTLKEKLKNNESVHTNGNATKSSGIFASDESDDECLQEKVKSSYTNSLNTAKVSGNESSQDAIVDESVNISKKPLTKAALAKRMLKKKVKPNTITKFDEQGEAVREICGKQFPIVGADLKKELLEEGYSIEKAKLLKEKEDEVDRMVFKERIKSKHREERLKVKQKNLERNPDGASAKLDDTQGDLQNDGSESEFGDVDPNAETFNSDESYESDDSADEQSESEPDNEQEREENSDVPENSTEEESDEYSNVESQSQSGSKKMGFKEKLKARKRLLKEKEQSRKKMKVSRTIEDDEQLALHFLTNT
ncbi:hypothetical protein JTE90_000608 [Oedothorax gibbosus]|uniref:ATP-dependent RNA helicase n=1 Tax=Oedothorax gibbosus TaxID=931172 RepID=A0AAV6VV99_9ARAC|nr:hypothetical protein JTE90_000608 [Oedothorax gibbosus]